jgi:nucleotide-binding universal stress UspA family protein
MLQLSSVTVPLDGSSFAEQAIPLAARLARSSSATLRLVLVHTPASTWDPGVAFSLFDPDVEVQVREREYAYIDAIARKLTAEGKLHVECALLSGSIAESLEDFSIVLESGESDLLAEFVEMLYRRVTEKVAK